MEKDLSMKVSRQANRSRDVWEKAVNNCPQITNFFHVRPQSKGSKVICTWTEGKNTAMRGAPKDAVCAQNLSIILDGIAAGLQRGQRMNDILVDAKFNQQKQTTSKRENEYAVQSSFINQMRSNPDLLIFLGEDYGELEFVASEFVYTLPGDNKKEIIDVIAECKEYILVFEIKKGSAPNGGDNTHQLEEYIDKYFCHQKVQTLELLSNYPNHSIVDDKPVKGFYLAMADKHNEQQINGYPVIRYFLNAGGIQICGTDNQ